MLEADTRPAEAAIRTRRQACAAGSRIEGTRQGVARGARTKRAEMRELGEKSRRASASSPAIEQKFTDLMLGCRNMPRE